jgi:hypothetical protein
MFFCSVVYLVCMSTRSDVYKQKTLAVENLLDSVLQVSIIAAKFPLDSSTT